MATTGIGKTYLAAFDSLDFHRILFVAYRLLQQTSYPSWLYSVDRGATTIWERLNSYTIDNGFGWAIMTVLMEGFIVSGRLRTIRLLCQLIP